MSQKSNVKAVYLSWHHMLQKPHQTGPHFCMTVNTKVNAETPHHKISSPETHKLILLIQFGPKDLSRSCMAGSTVSNHA